MSTESFAQLLEANDILSSLNPGALIKGKVVKVMHDTVMVYTGLKSNSYVKLEQFKNEQGSVDVAEGEEYEFVLESIENGYGETKLSREKARQVRSWNLVRESYKNDSPVDGNVITKVKGGFTVDLQGLMAFLPGSLADIRHGREAANLEGKTLQFKVVKMDGKRNNVVVSHRSILEEQKQTITQEAMETLFEGKVVKGVVKNLTEYGAFIDLGSIDGLLHITDMRWKRVSHPSEVVKVGEELELVILKFEKEKTRVSLGLKQLSVDPWERVNNLYNIGDQLNAIVTSVTEYGCFVSLDEGVEGLVHVSEMDWLSKNINPSKIVSNGDTVQVQILEIDQERHRISLGMKQCTENPWENFEKKQSPGDTVDGTVKSITEFGIFVSIDGDLDGLVHVNDLSWTKTPDQALAEYKKGASVQVKILSIDAAEQKIFLGVKQLSEDAFAKYLQANPKNSLVMGTVHKLEEKRVIISLDDEVRGAIKSQELYSKETGAYRVKEGDSLELRVMGDDRKNSLVMLSYKLAQEASSQEIKEYSKAQEKSIGSTIGSLLRDQLGFKKEE